MSKKTKKQKEAAELRKREILLRVYSTQPMTELAESAESSESSEKPAPAVKQPVSSFFITDLKKSLIIICFILALEIALYFGRIYN